MKQFLFYIIILGITFTYSCNKNEGCKDLNALNYDVEADNAKNDECRYSSVTLYAGSNTIFGQLITSIEISIDEEMIGTISTFNVDYPENCDTEGTLKYTFLSGNSQTWFAQYSLSSGGSVTQQGDISPKSDEECIRVDVTP